MTASDPLSLEEARAALTRCGGCGGDGSCAGKPNACQWCSGSGFDPAKVAALKLLLDEERRACAEVVRSGLEQPCNDTAHDPRWCATCDTRGDWLEWAASTIISRDQEPGSDGKPLTR